MIYYETEGVNKDGTPYESGGCTHDVEFLQSLFTEFLESFKRHSEESKIQFCYCNVHPEHPKRSCADHDDCDAAMEAEIMKGGTFLSHPPKRMS